MSQVEASYLEIYNEELSDLLGGDSKSSKLQIVEERDTKGKKGRGKQRVGNSMSIQSLIDCAQVSFARVWRSCRSILQSLCWT